MTFAGEPVTKSQVAGTLKLLRYYRDFLASDCELCRNPESQWADTLTKGQARRRLRFLVNTAINRKAGVPDVACRKQDADYQAGLRRDCNRVRDRVNRRVIVRSSRRPRFAVDTATSDQAGGRMKRRASLITTATLDSYIAGLKANECKVMRDNGAGTVKAFDGEHAVLKAIQKGRGGPWIAMFIDSDRITWSVPDEQRRPTAPGVRLRRASTKKQIDSPRPRKKHQKYAAFNNLGDVTFFVDAAKSGKAPWEDRDAGKELFKQLRPGDHIIIARLDRAFRRLADCVVVLEKFERLGVKIHVCNMLGGASTCPRRWAGS